MARKSTATSKLTIPDADWAPPKLDEQGRELDEHGLPTNMIQRTLAVAESGKSDPAGLVTDDQVAALNMDGVQADQEAVAAYRIERDWGADADAESIAAATPVAANPESLADAGTAGTAGSNGE